jgi:hypothetical protein
VSDNNWSAQFIVAAGSVQGREHARLQRNNQDGVAVSVTPERIVAVVSDGCGSGRSSEVGARLGAAWIAAQLPRFADGAPDAATLGARLTDGLAGYLRLIADGLGGTPDVLHDYLLFTFLAALVEPERTWVLGVGDGVVSVNGAASWLDAGPDNAPPYVAYRLLGDPRLAFVPCVHHAGPTVDLHTLAIGTDGLADLEARKGEPLGDGQPQGGLAQLVDHPQHLVNPSLVHKRLCALGERHRRLRDDATLVVIRRREVRS